MRIRIISICVLSFFLLFLLPGCGMISKLTQPPPQEEQSEKIPKQLEELEKSIEKIFTALEEEEKKKENTDNPSEQASENEQNPSEQDQKEEGQTTKDPWQQVKEEIQSLHVSWNGYMPELTKKGAKKELLDDFSEALNSLTKVTDSKDKNQVLLAANNLYQNIPDMVSLYKTKTSPELKRIIYYSRNIILYSEVEDWEKSTSAVEDLKSLWSLIQNTVAKEKQEDQMKLDLSIYELEKVVKQKNKELVKIKGNITLTNIEALQKQSSA